MVYGKLSEVGGANNCNKFWQRTKHVSSRAVPISTPYAQDSRTEVGKVVIVGNS